MTCSVDPYNILDTDLSGSYEEMYPSYSSILENLEYELADEKIESSPFMQDESKSYKVLKDNKLNEYYKKYGDTKIDSKINEAFYSMLDNDITRPKDTVIVLDVTLEDLYNGKSVNLKQKRKVLCSACLGTGKELTDEIHTCSMCKGQGQKVKLVSKDCISSKIVEKCKYCNGKGELYVTKGICNMCSGKRFTEKLEEIEFNIKPGLKNNDKIVLKNQGNQGLNKEFGNIVIILKEQKHELFERLNNDLLIRRQVSLTEALFGYKTLIHFLNNKSVILKSGGVLRPNIMQKVEGYGMPIPNQPGKYGDLYIDISINFPENFVTTDTEAYISDQANEFIECDNYYQLKPVSDSDNPFLEDMY